MPRFKLKCMVKYFQINIITVYFKLEAYQVPKTFSSSAPDTQWGRRVFVCN